MSIRLRKRTDKKGRNAVSRNFTIYFKDHLNNERAIVGFTDRNATVVLERNIIRLVEFRMAGYGLNAKLIDFLHSCPSTVLRKLVEWGIVDRKFTACSKTLMEYLNDWRLELVARNNTAAHINNFCSKVTRLIQHCNWQTLSDINIEDAKKWLIHREKTEKASTETRNHDIQAIKGFCNWLADKGCIASPHPLQPIKTKSAKGDRRRVRRPFAHDDFIRLLEHTVAGSKHHGLTGMVRALCYKLAVRTGMRHSEVRSLTPESFNMDVDQPTVFLKGKDAKNKKDQLFIITPELVEELRDHLKTIQPGKRVFNMHKGRGAVMLAEDLKAAGITILDSFGRTLDFHALRHTYSVDLGLAGVNPLVRQKLMRHSSAAVMERYSEVDLEHHAEALSKLPSLIPAKKQVDRLVDRQKVNRTVLNGTFEGKNEDGISSGKTREDRQYPLSNNRIAKRTIGEKLEAASRFELEVHGFANHCLTTWLRRLVGMEIRYGVENARNQFTHLSSQVKRKRKTRAEKPQSATFNLLDAEDKRRENRVPRDF